MLPVSPVYALAYHKIRQVCLDHGYAPALHGSCVRDLDIIAIPFDNKVDPIDQLVENVRKAIHGEFVKNKNLPIKKNYGRLVWLINLDEHHYVDFSVIPLQEL